MSLIRWHIIQIGGDQKNSLIFKIGGPKVQKYQNRGTKSAFKPNNKILVSFGSYHVSCTVIDLIKDSIVDRFWCGDFGHLSSSHSLSELNDSFRHGWLIWLPSFWYRLRGVWSRIEVSRSFRKWRSDAEFLWRWNRVYMFKQLEWVFISVACSSSCRKSQMSL
jgi:hypothetical protein